MQSLARTISRSRAHKPRTLYRTVSTGTRISDSRPSASTSSHSSLSATGEDEPPPKIYAKLPAAPPSISLSEEKLRHLISLYHSSSSFITPETLSDEIDKAFVPLRSNRSGIRPESYQELAKRRSDRADEPDRVVPTANDMRGSHAIYDQPAGGWSSSQSGREREVKGALWGVDPLGRIGLETLLEAKAEMDAFKETEEPQPPKKES